MAILSINSLNQVGYTMKSLVIKSQSHFTFPAHYGWNGELPKYDKIEFEECSQFKLHLGDARWCHIKSIIIRNANSIEFSLDLPEESELEDILMINADYVHIKEIRGSFPEI